MVCGKRRNRNEKGEKAMNIKPRNFAMLVGAGAVAVAVASAPGAAAATTTESGGSTTTQRPGHVSIHTTPPLVSLPKVWGSHSSPLFVLGD
jgi:hypothetical protein